MARANTYYSQDNGATFSPIEVQLAPDEERELSFWDGFYCTAKCQLSGELTLDFNNISSNGSPESFTNYFPCITGVWEPFPKIPGG